MNEIRVFILWEGDEINGGLDPGRRELTDAPPPKGLAIAFAV